MIRDKDTGRPIAGVTLRGSVYKEHSRHPGAGRRGDDRRPGPLSPHRPAQGTGLSPVRRAGARASLIPGPTLRVPADSPALEPVTFDIALKRGILVRGRVTDKATGRPVPGYVNAYAFRDNPHVREFPGYEQSYLQLRPSSRTTAGTRSSPCRAAASSPAAPS